ncbi:unnamed protein product [Brassica oleracea var. botrytis]
MPSLFPNVSLDNFKMMQNEALKKLDRTNTFIGKMNQGDTSVREYNTKFLAWGLLDKHDEATLIKMYRDGLREDIRSEIGTTVFSTIDEIMDAALDVEEGESPCDSNSSDTKSDDSGSDENGRRPKKKARTEKNHNDHREDEDHDENSMAGHVLPNLLDEIIVKIIELLVEETFYYLGDFLRAGKRDYALVHEPSVLKIYDVTPMVSFATCSNQQWWSVSRVLPQVC